MESNKSNEFRTLRKVIGLTQTELAEKLELSVKMNAGLKRLGIVCGIDTPTRIVYFSGSRRIENVVPKYELLTTHVARRTFVVTALSLGVAADVIMRWTGHSDYKAMKPYIAIVDELKRNSMKKFDEI